MVLELNNISKYYGDKKIFEILFNLEEHMPLGILMEL